MTEPNVKKPRPKARSRRLVVPKPSPAPRIETVPHPVFWVQCFGCGQETRLFQSPSGRALLPESWVTLYITNRESRIESPDVYASPDCERRAVKRLAEKYNSDQVTVMKPSASFGDGESAESSDKG